MKWIYFLAITLAFSNILNSQKKNDFTLYLIGDTGAPIMDGNDPVLDKLASELKNQGKNSGIVYLGDNIYHHGMPTPDHKEERKRTEAVMARQLDVIKDFKGKIFFIPGNHDWNDAKAGGRIYLKEEEKFIEDYLDRGNVMIPDNGCPGPTVKKLGDNAVLIAMDSQWWLHPHDDDANWSGCSNKKTYGIIQELKELLGKHDDKFIVIAFHHPIYTAGSHNGHFTLKDMFFPLTAVNKHLYLPLPGLGFLYPFYRTAFGAKQDVPHPLYQKFRKEITDALSGYKNIIIASGHEHNLQYYNKLDNHYVVSGSGSKTTPLRKEKDAEFQSDKKGFAKVEFYNDGSAELIFIRADKKEAVFKKEIIERKLTAPTERNTYILSSQTKKDKASDIYNTSKFHKFLFGKTYRKDWNTEVVVRNMNLSEEKGGLIPIQMGGGFSSNSLRLQSPDDKEYVLRSVQKGVVKIIPPQFRGTFVQSVFQDQIGASQPYAALAVPALAEAAKVYHTTPEIVYIEEQPALGEYNAKFGNALYLYEERPAGDREDEEALGGSSKIVSYRSVLNALKKSHKARINQNQVLRSRLFDLYLGDWDRHDDQWRWARFTEQQHGKKHTYYEPIPRDRDQVFFGYKGFVPSLTKLLSPELRKFVYFDDEIKKPKLLGFNARHFDRHFLNQMDKNDWLNMAQELQSNLTDEAIAKSMDALPKPIRDLRADEYTRKLKNRRKDIKKYAGELYDYVAKYVDVPGTEDKELFEIERKPGNITEVKVYDLNKKNEKEDLFYSRTIRGSETKEIRLYGREGADIFNLTGVQNNGTLIRIIGGKGKDVIKDMSTVRGGSKKTIVYDSKITESTSLGTEAKYIKTTHPSENEYDRKEFYYNATTSLPAISYDPDNGLSIINLFSHNNYGWRKDPYSSSHQLATKYSFGSDELTLRYRSEFIEAIGKADLLIDVDASLPSDKENFFALSNDRLVALSTIDDFSNVRYEQRRITIRPAIQLSSENRLHKLALSPYYEYTKLGDNEGKLIAGLPLFEIEKEENSFVGLSVDYTMHKVDNSIYPTTGIDFKFNPYYNYDIGSSQNNFFGIRGHLIAYNFIPLPRPAVWATSISGGINFGDFSFYQANFLGRKTGFRGYRNNRLGGKSSLIWSNDLRVKLFQVKGKVLPFTFGIIGAYDYGRVWNDDEVSIEGWHKAYGGGFWISPFDLGNLSFYLMRAPADNELEENESTFSFKFGFAF